MTSTPTAIDFPDPTDPGFDETVPFEAPNGQSYLWNGYGWELVCEIEDIYLLKNGETVNAPGPVNYQWDQNVDIKSTKILDIRGTLGCYLNSNGTVDVTAPDLNVYANTAVWMESKEYRFTNYSNSNIKWLHLKNGVIETDTTVSDTSSDKSLTTKKYVDDLFDFSQYDPLP